LPSQLTEYDRYSNHCRNLAESLERERERDREAHRNVSMYLMTKISEINALKRWGFMWIAAAELQKRMTMQKKSGTTN